LRTHRLTSVGGVALGWDAPGNVSNGGARSLRYDHANRLKQVTEGSLTTHFAYNGDGVRVGKTIGAAATDYLVDLAAALPVVISDTDAVYLYGLDIIAEQLAGADRYYYVHDGLGSVRQLVDSTGQVETRYTYDPFGVPLEGNGVPNPWQFTGEAWDAGVGLLYLRARYYQPGTGRFVTKDPWPGNVWRPQTLKPYVYVGNSPANYADPSGLQGSYDAYESFMQAVGLARDWFTERGQVVQRFGPNEPLTMDVRHSRGVQDFKREWAEEGEYRVPWTWDKHSIDVREGAPLAVRLVWAGKTFARSQWNLFRCAIGRGSPTAEGQVDPVLGILGSFNLVSVYLSPEGGTEMLTFEVYNVMGRRSFLRVKGTKYSPLVNVERGESGGWGGTTYQYFYWYEPVSDYPEVTIPRPMFGPKWPEPAPVPTWPVFGPKLPPQAPPPTQAVKCESVKYKKYKGPWRAGATTWTVSGLEWPPTAAARAQLVKCKSMKYRSLW
jgi:RHS repeat-associated protein